MADHFQVWDDNSMYLFCMKNTVKLSLKLLEPETAKTSEGSEWYQIGLK